ncbi:hypothetical protein N869_00905 [Cellulomonas bogoriensis 69B4 = DSM 16987]|uniref:Uncharacterized protein n=1 Tax=Cellulomonas bogoriensis 69B4 = DSM 16987 TaxID=1386082 RepID=A0A0A0C0G9_9CELL|nr:hypothetical protein N869_00905 [Cellulomonas bogoriensis 69B4 = DSM 16987]
MGVVAGAVLLAVTLAQVALGVFSAYNLGHSLSSTIVPWVIVSCIVFFARRRWGWWAIIGTYLGMWLLISIMGATGRIGAFL